MRRPTAIVAAILTVALAGCSSTQPGGPAGTVPNTTTTTASATTTTAPTTTASAPAAPTTPSAPTGWLTYDHDPQHTGTDPTTAAASPPNPHPAWTSPLLDGAVYAQPLVTDHAVIVATENDSLYSLDPSTGAIQWMRHLATPVNATTLPCGDINPSGITGTPVIDAATRLVWVVTFSPDPDRHTLWAVHLQDGTVATSKPADPPNADPSTEQQRGALALTNGRVYIPYGGLYGDCGDYHGQVEAISTAIGTAATATRPLTYTTPATEAGIWAPPGPVVDGAGDLLVATGNGEPANPPGDANSVILLTPTLSKQAIFTAPDYATLSQTDRDLGSTSPTLVGADVLEVGKEGVAYLLDPTLHPTATPTKVCAGGFGGTAVDGTTVFLSCFDGLYALHVNPNGVTTDWEVTTIKPGPPIVAGGTVWTVDRGGHLDGYQTRSGRPVYTHAVAVAGSFPTLAAYRGSLYVPDGDRIEVFAGA